jgi:hypothetical protein
LNERNHQDFAAAAFHHLPANDLLEGIVPALHQNVREQGADERLWSVVVEEGDGIHGLQTRQHESSIGLGHHWAPGAFEPLYRSVGVHSHDQGVTKAASLVEIVHMAAVQEVEASVGEHQPERPWAAEPGDDLPPGKNLSPGRTRLLRGTSTHRSIPKVRFTTMQGGGIRLEDLSHEPLKIRNQ